MGFYSGYRWARRMLPPGRCCVADIAEVTGLSVQAIRRRLARGDYKARRAEYVWRCGGKSYLRLLWIIPLPIARQMVTDHFTRGLGQAEAILKSLKERQQRGQ